MAGIPYLYILKNEELRMKHGKNLRRSPIYTEEKSNISSPVILMH